MNLLIKIINLTIQRNNRNILDNISLDIHTKSFLNIYGANGSGKTSFLKVITGISEIESGEIVNNSNNQVYVGHKYGLKNNLTVSENLMFDLQNNNIDKTHKLSEALEIYKMSKFKDTLVKHLSHGQQKRVSLMRTILLDSDFWVLDEPFSALDDETKRILNETFVEAIKHNKTIIVTGHNTFKHDLIKVQNYVLKDGRIQ
tara:strand:- start:2822 stop:3424 length:603 start_codon:yes stop_codon:yes gene_type:complete